MDTLNQLENGLDRLLQTVARLKEENYRLKVELENSRAGISAEVDRLKEELLHEKSVKDAVLAKVEDLIKKLADTES